MGHYGAGFAQSGALRVQAVPIGCRVTQGDRHPGVSQWVVWFDQGSFQKLRGAEATGGRHLHQERRLKEKTRRRRK
ncbi:unnamed protein product [Arctogadus glacialis]